MNSHVLPWCARWGPSTVEGSSICRKGAETAMDLHLVLGQRLLVAVLASLGLFVCRLLVGCKDRPRMLEQDAKVPTAGACRYWLLLVATGCWLLVGWHSAKLVQRGDAGQSRRPSGVPQAKSSRAVPPCNMPSATARSTVAYPIAPQQGTVQLPKFPLMTVT